MIMIPDFEKVYIVFAAPLAFSILSLMSAIVAVALFYLENMKMLELSQLIVYCILLSLLAFMLLWSVS
jgi:hypothetical protein